ncbi:TfoX/Sxy family protein [Reyranella sp.]|uniref:TfoX/Sxy family protein n=1 Tax=Reyranella sp. TaxID=1929291 RepID=UPI003BABDD59
MKGTWKKAPSELVAAFDAAIAGRPGVERRQMFGYPCAFLNGNMLTGLFQDQMMVRLSEADRATASLDAAAVPFAPGGRPMREYVVLPAAIVADAKGLGGWLDRAIAFVGTLPPKAPKSPAKAKPAAKRLRRG